MSAAPFPRVETKTDFFSFRGGLNLETPPLQVPPGALMHCRNYEPTVMGGYARGGNYERYDGRVSPSAQGYLIVLATMTSVPAAGVTLTIGAASARFVAARDGAIVVTAVSGTIPGSTAITGTGAAGVTAANPAGAYSLTARDDALMRAQTADVYRAAIAKPPGSGPIRGVAWYAGTLWCWRDNVGATAGQMFKATPTGWQLQALGEEIAFSNANVNVGDGDTLTQGGVTATIRRVIVETGTLQSGTNTGRLILAARAGGSFASGAATSTGSGALTLGGAQAAIGLPAGGVYQHDVYNFSGQLSTRRLYFCNGVGRACEWDGSTLVPIGTLFPKFLRGHRRYLYTAVGSSLLNSSVGDPMRTVTAEGAAEIAVGDEITGLAALPGEALGVFCRNSSHALTGASSATWSMTSIRPDVGSLPFTVQNMSDVFLLDDRGITSVAAADTYGNFQDATLSRHVQRLIDRVRSLVVTSYVNRSKGHYVLLLNNGETLTMGVNEQKVNGITTGQLGFVPSCATSSEDGTGTERVFVGGSDGMVYELGRGSSQDGASIEAYIKVFYLSSKSPEAVKRYRLLVPQVNVLLYSEMKFQAEYSFGDPLTPQSAAYDVDIAGAGGSWDFVNWDEFFWGAADIQRVAIPMKGEGLNVALFFYSNTALDIGHTLSGAVMHYTPRRLRRE